LVLQYLRLALLSSGLFILIILDDLVFILTDQFYFELLSILLSNNHHCEQKLETLLAFVEIHCFVAPCH
jgi:hypothetical protein